MKFCFHLRLTSQQCLDYYRGAAPSVVVQADTGQTIQFPASLLRRFVTINGIEGDFVLTCDENHKNPRLEKA